MSDELIIPEVMPRLTPGNLGSRLKAYITKRKAQQAQGPVVPVRTVSKDQLQQMVRKAGR